MRQEMLCIKVDELQICSLGIITYTCSFKSMSGSFALTLWLQMVVPHGQNNMLARVDHTFPQDQLLVLARGTSSPSVQHILLTVLLEEYPLPPHHMFYISSLAIGPHNFLAHDQVGATLLHHAVYAASSQMIKILFLYNIDINLEDNDGWTPLHLAVLSRRTDIVKLLLIKGADKTLMNRDGLTPLDLCLYSGKDIRTYELIRLIKQRT